MVSVSIIVPCYNEQATIRLLLEAIYQQTFPRQQMEVIIADGMSTDRTRIEVASFQQAYPDLAIRMVDNRKRTIPSGLNQAIAAAQGTYIVRMDAHSKPYPNYVARCVADLEQGLGENVGGAWEIQPGGKSGMAQAIAVAAAHPLGVGDAHYRHARRAQAVDTVPFGAFRKALVERIGGFDETLLTNEDYEFNVRVRQCGVVWLDPEIRSVYYARSSLGALARQYGRYGFWKGQMLRRYPRTLRWRQALPPAFVASLVIMLLLALVLPVARWLLAVEVGVYCLALLGVGIQTAIKNNAPAFAAEMPLAMAVMHLSWGAALLWSLLQIKREK